MQTKDAINVDMNGPEVPQQNQVSEARDEDVTMAEPQEKVMPEAEHDNYVEVIKAQEDRLFELTKFKGMLTGVGYQMTATISEMSKAEKRAITPTVVDGVRKRYEEFNQKAMQRIDAEIVETELTILRH